jgi:hypothetical protein
MERLTDGGGMNMRCGSWKESKSENEIPEMIRANITSPLEVEEGLKQINGTK